VRTTINVDEELLRAVRRRAAARGATLSEFVEDAIRQMLARDTQPSPERPFRLITFGAAGAQPGVDLDRASALLEADDLERYGNRGGP
jgi:plasmid stability protein